MAQPVEPGKVIFFLFLGRVSADFSTVTTCQKGSPHSGACAQQGEGESCTRAGGHRAAVFVWQPRCSIVRMSKSTISSLEALRPSMWGICLVLFIAYLCGHFSKPGVLLVVGGLWMAYTSRRHDARIQHEVDVLASRAWRDTQVLQDLLEKSFPGLPRAVRYPGEFDTSSWLNEFLPSVWSHVNIGVGGLLQRILHTKMQQRRPEWLSYIGLHTLDFGGTPPFVEGVKFFTRGDGRVMVDASCMFVADDAQRVNVRARKGALWVNVRLQNLKMRFTLRVTLKRLTHMLPCFEQLTLSFAEKPEIDFQMTGLKVNLTSVPGLSSWLRRFVDTAIAQALVWPNEKAVYTPNLDKLNRYRCVRDVGVDRGPAYVLRNAEARAGDSPFRNTGDAKRRTNPHSVNAAALIHDVLEPQGILTVILRQAVDLCSADARPSPDRKSKKLSPHPIATITLGATSSVSSRKKHTCSPIWNEAFELVLHSFDMQNLRIDIHDAKKRGYGFLGGVLMPLSDVPGFNGARRVYVQSLIGGLGGTLHISLQFNPFSAGKSSPARGIQTKTFRTVEQSTDTTDAVKDPDLKVPSSSQKVPTSHSPQPNQRQRPSRRMSLQSKSSSPIPLQQRRSSSADARPPSLAVAAAGQREGVAAGRGGWPGTPPTKVLGSLPPEDLLLSGTSAATAFTARTPASSAAARVLFADGGQTPGAGTHSDASRLSIIDSVQSVKRDVASDDDQTSAKPATETATVQFKPANNGLLRVTVIRAENLKNRGKGSLDPYVIVTLKKVKRRTRVFPDGADPVWNETFEFRVEDDRKDVLSINIYDKERNKFDKSEGNIRIPIRQIIALANGASPYVVTARWKLSKTTQGFLYLCLRYYQKQIYVRGQGVESVGAAVSEAPRGRRARRAQRAAEAAAEAAAAAAATAKRLGRVSVSPARAQRGLPSPSPTRGSVRTPAKAKKGGPRKFLGWFGWRGRKARAAAAADRGREGQPSPPPPSVSETQTRKSSTPPKGALNNHPIKGALGNTSSAVVKTARTLPILGESDLSAAAVSSMPSLKQK